MHKKHLRTYTLLGLMLCSLVTPGLAGKYEDEFLAEVKRGCSSLLCVPSKNGGHWTSETRRIERVIRTETTYTASDSHSCPVITYTPHHKDIVEVNYRTEDVWHPKDPICLKCRGAGEYYYGLPRYGLNYVKPKFSVKTSPGATTIHMEPQKLCLAPCHAFYKGDFRNPLLAKICCQEAVSDIYFGGVWKNLLVALWSFAVKLDDEESGKKTLPQNSTTEILALKREVIEDDSSCIVQ